MFYIQYFIFINILYNMALKNRRTQNKKSNQKRQQSKRGGKRKSVKRIRRTRKGGGGNTKEDLFNKIHSQSMNMKVLLKTYMDNEGIVVTDDQIVIIQTKIQKNGLKRIDDLDKIIQDVTLYELEE